MPWVEVQEIDVENAKKNEVLEQNIGRTFMGFPLKDFEEYVFKPFKFELLKGTTTTPLPRSGHRVVSEEGNLYSFGGYLEKARTIAGIPLALIPPSSYQQLFEELWELNSMTNEWRHLVTYGETPKELASHSMLLQGHYLVVYGGTGVPFGGSSSNKMHVCNLRTLTWHPVETSGELPYPQYGQAVVMDKDSAFYVVGGTTGYDYSIDVHKLNMKTFEWEALFIAKGDMCEPMARYRHEIALEKDIIFVLGGGTAIQSFDLAVLPAFSVKTREWAHVQTVSHNGQYPRPRKCHGYVRRGEDVYICGGYNNRHIFNDIWKLHLPTLEWTKLNAVMPVPTYFHATTITPAGCLFIYGGVIDVKTSTRTDQLYKVWLTVPNLKELSWSAVHQYARKTDPPCLNDIIASIPVEFRDRLPRKVPEENIWSNGCPIPPIRPRNPPPPKTLPSPDKDVEMEI